MARRAALKETSKRPSVEASMGKLYAKHRGAMDELAK